MLDSVDSHELRSESTGPTEEGYRRQLFSINVNCRLSSSKLAP